MYFLYFTGILFVYTLIKVTMRYYFGESKNETYLLVMELNLEDIVKKKLEFYSNGSLFYINQNAQEMAFHFMSTVEIMFVSVHCMYIPIFFRKQLSVLLRKSPQINWFSSTENSIKIYLPTAETSVPCMLKISNFNFFNSHVMEIKNPSLVKLHCFYLI